MAKDEGTIISESTLVHGNVEGDEDVTIRGRLEGSLRLSRSLTVEPTAVVKAEIHVRSAVISGSVEGNVTATDSVEITREGRLVGDVTSPRVVITDGASFQGRIETGEAPEPVEERPALARTASRPALRPPPRAERPARADRGDEGAGEEDEGEAEAPPAPARSSLSERVAAVVRPPAPPVPVAMGGMKRKVVVRRK